MRTIIRSKSHFFGKLSRRIIYFYKAIIRQPDAPHEIAFAAAVGCFLGILPTLGIAMVLAVIAAYFLKLNKFVAMAGTWMNNPWTAPLLYPFSYWLGCKILHYEIGAINAQIKIFFSCMINYSHYLLAQIQSFVFGIHIHRVKPEIDWDFVFNFAKAFWLGSSIVSMFVSIVFYFFIFFAVVEYQKTRELLKKLKRKKRKNKEVPHV